MDYEQLIMEIVQSNSIWNDLKVDSKKLNYIEHKIGRISEKEGIILASVIDMLINEYMPDKEYEDKQTRKAVQSITVMLAIITLAEASQNDYAIIQNITHYVLVGIIIYFLYKIDGDKEDIKKINENKQTISKKLNIIKLACQGIKKS